MKAPWYKRNTTLFEATKTELTTHYPDLRVVNEHGTVYIRGNLPVMDGADVLDRFLIEIEFPFDYPESIPVLREIGGRIPWSADRHTNRENGEACPIVPEEWLIRADHDSILAFLNGPVRNFFLGQILAEEGRPWPFGEREHGIPGLIEAYGEIVGTSDEHTLRRYLDCLSRESLKGHWECPCGSLKRLRDCHLNVIKSLGERIPPRVAQQALSRLNDLSARQRRNATPPAPRRIE
jgi:hypothetical protein